jgi:hypothetical protein
MKKYHIVFFESKADRISTGISLEAKDELQALEIFRQKRPTAIFLHLASPEMRSLVS